MTLRPPEQRLHNRERTVGGALGGQAGSLLASVVPLAYRAHVLPGDARSPVHPILGLRQGTPDQVRGVRRVGTGGQQNGRQAARPVIRVDVRPAAYSLQQEHRMTNHNSPADRDGGNELPLPVEPGTTDLGDDVYRGADNDGSVLGDTPRSGTSHTDFDPGSGLPILIDPGTTDLGDDVYRDADNHGSSLGDAPRAADVDPGSGLPIRIDPATLDLGDDVYRA